MFRKLMNTGEKAVKSEHGLLTTLVWGWMARLSMLLKEAFLFCCRIGHSMAARRLVNAEERERPGGNRVTVGNRLFI
ncbi:glycerol kinase [Mesobacillus boroniphilus JCM 21738]|uniref:Glycerol kinase n=1 Tax=Mesobacillus boroniphilus JCM 21738 TaxID=1294265 RepID=W4RUM4_9BACI|nr:glycerol kinase [Mesobacillus boroniphilus JCM 21738]